MLLGFPEAPQAEIDLNIPIAAKGVVNAISTTSEVATADYHGGMSACSLSACGRNLIVTEQQQYVHVDPMRCHSRWSGEAEGSNIVSCHCCICNLYVDFVCAAMPSAPGAPVLVDGHTLAGVHTGSLFHLDQECVQEQKQEV